MPSLIKCPRCPFHLDVTSAAPGSTVSCPNCRAPVRVPGQGKPADVPVAEIADETPSSKPKPAQRSTFGTTPIFRKASGGKAKGRTRLEERASTGNRFSNWPTIVITLLLLGGAAAGLYMYVLNAEKPEAPVRAKMPGRP